MTQLSINFTPEATACMEKAKSIDPDFPAKAEKFILEHLAIVKQCPGEELTDVARAKGAIPHDDRAFGGVFQRLSRRNLIRTVGFCERKKGHGTAGGRVWGIVL